MGKIARKKTRELVIDPGPEITPLTQLLEEGADRLKQLRSLEAKRRLTGSAFVAYALREAGIDEQRLFHCRKVITEAGGEAFNFVRHCARHYREPHWPTPAHADKCARLVKIYGNYGAAHAALNELGVKVVEASAVAAAVSVERYGSRFGEIADYDSHCARVEELRGELHTIQEQMRRVWSQDDVIQLPVSHQDRSGGLIRLGFKVAPDLHPGTDDWPARLIERMAGDKRTLSREEIAALEQDDTEPVGYGAVAYGNAHRLLDGVR